MKPTYNLVLILQCVCSYFAITENQIKSTSRRADIVKIRHIFFYLCFEYSDFSMVKIGLFLNRNHATVIHAVKRIKRERFMYDDISKPLQMIEKKLMCGIDIQDLNLLEIAKYNTLQKNISTLNLKKWKYQKN